MTESGPESLPAQRHREGSDVSAREPDGSVGGLLISANFGPEPKLRLFNLVQNEIRTFLLRCADYQCSLVAEPNIVPDSWYGVVDYSRLEGEDWPIEDFTALVEPRRPDEYPLYPEVLSHVAGAAVNPWMEIVTAAGGTAVLATAGWKALANANQIFDFFVRVRNWRHENDAHVSRIRQLAVRERCETVVEIIDQLDDTARGVAAAHLLSMALDLSDETLDQVQLQQISPSEVASRRSHIENSISGDLPLVRGLDEVRTTRTTTDRLEGPGSNNELTRGGD